MPILNRTGSSRITILPCNPRTHPSLNTLRAISQNHPATHEIQATHGGVLVEFSLLSVTLLLLLVSAFDIGQMLHSYLLLSQACFEGARSASMTVGLSGDLTVTTTPTQNELKLCGEEMLDLSKNPKLPCGLLLANARMQHILSLYGTAVELDSVQYSSAIEGTGSIVVSLSAANHALLPVFRLIPIRANARLPYMVLNAKNPQIPTTSG